MIALLLLSLNLYSSWSALVKTIMNVLVVGFFWVTYQSWPGLLGWPTENDLPEKFYLHAVHVDEPYKVYLWGTDLDDGLGQTIPRSFSMPYSAKLHDAADKAGRKLRKGLPMIGQVSQNVGANTEVSNLEQTQASDSDVIFIDAPQSLVPGKN